eukprot:8078961-Lingulodinium_polyedra.AAC.1
MPGHFPSVNPPPDVRLQAQRHHVPVAVVANGVEELQGLQREVAQVGIRSSGARSFVQGGRPEPVVAPMLCNPRRDP